MKLNEKKIKYIIREKNKRRSSTEIAIDLYGKPEEILTDHGTQFFSNGKNGIPGDHNKFLKYYVINKMTLIFAKIKFYYIRKTIIN